MEINKEWRSFRFLCKVDRNYTPRDLSKLKDRIDFAVSHLTQKKPIDMEMLFNQLINACLLYTSDAADE